MLHIKKSDLNGSVQDFLDSINSYENKEASEVINNVFEIIENMFEMLSGRSDDDLYAYSMKDMIKHLSIDYSTSSLSDDEELRDFFFYCFNAGRIVTFIELFNELSDNKNDMVLFIKEIVLYSSKIKKLDTNKHSEIIENAFFVSNDFFNLIVSYDDIKENCDKHEFYNTLDEMLVDTVINQIAVIDNDEIVKIEVTGIEWDGADESISKTQILEANNLNINNVIEIENFIENELSNKTGFCHFGWSDYKVI